MLAPSARSFRLPDFARLLAASRGEVKVVQAGVRHASAKTTLDTSGTRGPQSDDSTPAAIKLIAARASVQTAMEPGQSPSLREDWPGCGYRPIDATL